MGRAHSVHHLVGRDRLRLAVDPLKGPLAG